MKRMEERVEEAMAEALGRDVRRCPNCGRIGSHWAPERIVDDRITPGRFTCGARS